jgi:K(+)-stimulated pyrophosphate-energized sodium pump
MLSKIWAEIQDAFGGIGPILLPMAIPVLEYYFFRIAVVKITDDNAKKHKFKSIKYRKLGFDRINPIACYFLVQYMLPNENGFLWRRH